MSTKKDAQEILEAIVGPLTIGRALRSIRKGEGMDLVQFSQKLRISKSHLSDIERDHKSLSPERAARFAKLLGYSQEQFVRLALQGLVEKSGLKMKVIVEAA